MRPGGFTTDDRNVASETCVALQASFAPSEARCRAFLHRRCNQSDARTNCQKHHLFVAGRVPSVHAIHSAAAICNTARTHQGGYSGVRDIKSIAKRKSKAVLRVK